MLMLISTAVHVLQRLLLESWTKIWLVSFVQVAKEVVESAVAPALQADSDLWFFLNRFVT